MVEPVFFTRPEGPAITLRSAPRLSNWNRVGDTGGARLTRALSYSQNAIDEQLQVCDGPVAVRFDVGLPRTTRLLDERDLDNYLLPLTAQLQAGAGQPIVSVWGCKRYSDVTTLRIEKARPRTDPGLTGVAELTTTVSGARDLFKVGLRKQIRDAVAGQTLLPDGPVILEVAYVVGPGRDWLDLWWATIDGLSPLLGQSPSEPEWHPRDGRITDLGLHWTLDPELGDDVRIALSARSGWLDPEPVTY